MSLDRSLLHVTEPETTDYKVTFTGAGAADPTKNFGAGVAVTWISTGLYELTWVDAPGAFVGYTWGLQATTAADLKGHTVVAGDYNTSTLKLRVSITNASETLVDLTSTRKCCLTIAFTEF